MENLIIWMSYGYGSFYFFGDFIGLRDNNLKYMALLGLSLGCVREISGKNLMYLLFKK
jgi:hypothetical protein